VSGASGWRDGVLRSAIDAFLCDGAAKSINRGVRSCIDAEKNSASAANSSIHALIRCVSGVRNCIVAAKSSIGGVVWCVDGVKDCIGGAVGPVGRTSVRHRGPLLRFECSDAPRLIDCGSLAFAFGCCFGRVRPGSSPPAGDLLLCFAKEVSKKGDPASPVGLRPTPLRCSQQAAGVANSPFGLKQRPRKSPPAAALLGGSDGLLPDTEPWLGLSSGLNGWRKAHPSRAFDLNDRLPGAGKFASTCSSRSIVASRRVTPCGLTRPTAARLVEFPKSPPASTRNHRLRKDSVIPESPFQTAEQHSNGRGLPARLCEPAQPASSAPAACCEQRREVVRASGRPVWPGRLSCLLSWRRKKVGRPPGRRRGFAEHCSAPLEPAGCANPAVERVPANPCQPKALPVGRTSVRHPSWGMAWCVGLKSDLQFDPQVSGPARQGAAMGTTP